MIKLIKEFFKKHSNSSSFPHFDECFDCRKGNCIGCKLNIKNEVK